MSRISIGAILAILLFATAAQAQLSNSGNTGNTSSGFGMNMAPGERRLSPEERQREQEIESRYRDAADKIPDKKGSKDPWGNIRSAPAR
jgi:hypothetical protein